MSGYSLGGATVSSYVAKQHVCRHVVVVGVRTTTVLYEALGPGLSVTSHRRLSDCS
jgi:hypothetical protein